MKQNIRTGKFEKTPEGEKTEKMLEVEKQIQKTLEEDYYEYYLNGSHGQKLLAKRWGVSRMLIFSSYGGRTSWIEKLKLPNKSGFIKKEKIIKGCENCGEINAGIENAHWISDSEGGSKKHYNILKLCPNCHTKLDNNNKDIEKRCKEILFSRSMKAFFDRKTISDSDQVDIFKIAEQIIKRRI